MSYKPGGDLINHDGRISQSVVAGFTDTFTINAEFHDIAAQTAFMLIDLSDTTAWPHTITGKIILEYLILQADPDNTYVGEIKLGFLTNVDAITGDFNQIIEIDLQKQSSLLVEIMHFGSHGFDCSVAHHFGLITADSTLFQTDVNLEGPDGNISYPSGDGDLVCLIEQSAGQLNVSLTIGYETAP